MFFVSIYLELTSPGNPIVGMLQLGVFAHAAVMNMISSLDAGLGRDLHNCQRHKPMSLAVLTVKPQRLTMRIAFMGERGMQAADALATSLARSAHIQLGAVRWHVEGIHLSGYPWAAICTWADLVEPCSENWLHFNFVSPTAIMKKDGWQRRKASILPEPNDVFRCLVERWQSLGGPRLPGNLLDYVKQGGCVISDINMRSDTSQLKEYVQKGFIGRVTYELNEVDPACVSALHQLGRLAFFSGVGYQTARGMGAVLTRSW